MSTSDTYFKQHRFSSCEYNPSQKGSQMSRTFHVLTESEPFTKGGGSLARWVANVVRSDQESIILAPSSDGSLAFDSNRVRIVRALSSYRVTYRAIGHFLPNWLVTQFLSRILSKSLIDIQAGDTVWIHDRPEFALAIAPLVQRAGARLFLHLHSAQLLTAYAGLLRATKADCYIFNNQVIERQARLKFPGMGRTAVLSAGLDPNAFHPAAKFASTTNSLDDPQKLATVVFSAYLAREDDLQVFLEAMEILRTRQVAVCGVVIGGPNLKSRETSPYQPERRITVPSNVSFETYDSPTALGKKLRASELFCVPSSWHKSASLYMLEALACGLPVVATQSADFSKETAGAPGILVVPNAAERLAQTVQQLVEDSSARHLLANMAYSTYIGKYMWYATQASYRSVLASSTLAASPVQLSTELIHA